MKRCGAESQTDNDGDDGSDSDGGKETRGQGQSKVKGKYTIQDCIDKFVEREQLVRTYIRMYVKQSAAHLKKITNTILSKMNVQSVCKLIFLERVY